jgi:hypothetical protein
VGSDDVAKVGTGLGHPAGEELGCQGQGEALHLLLHAVPAGCPPPHWGVPSHLQALAFAVFSAGPLLLCPHGPSSSSPSCRKLSEPPRAGHMSQTRQSFR